MTDETLRIMASVERRLNTLIGDVSVACGHPEGLAKAAKARDRLEKFIENEVEKLAVKAGVE